MAWFQTFYLSVVGDGPHNGLMRSDFKHQSPAGPFQCVVMLVDPNDDQREMYGEYLRWRNFRVVEAADGAAALQMALLGVADVIALELRLPRVDGFTLTTILKRQPETASIPVLALTASAFDSDVKKATECGCDAVLTKPCSPEALATEINRVTSRTLPSTLARRLRLSGASAGCR